MTATAEYPSVVQLIAMARVQPGSALPTETHQSYPVPVPGPQGLRVAFLYCPSNVHVQTGLLLLTPTYLAYLLARTGKFLELKAVELTELAPLGKKGELLGRYHMLPEGRTPEMFLAMQAKLFRDYDLLIPRFAEGPTRVPAEVKEAAAEFQTLFPQVTEAPLQPYYQALGKPFFAWLKGLKA